MNSGVLFLLKLVPCLILQITNYPQEKSSEIVASKTQNAREITFIGDEIRKVEENSLALDSSLATGSLAMDPSLRYTQVYPNGPKIMDSLPDVPNGMRLYRFIVPSGGNLRLKLKSESSRIVMAYLMRLQSNAMAAGIRKANMPPASVRRSRIELENRTESPQEAVLMLKGPVGVGFSLDIDRSWVRK